MGIAADSADRVVDGVTQAVDGASSLDQALRGIARELSAHFEIARATVRLLLADGARLVIAGIWSETDSSVTHGTTMTVASSSFPEVVAKRSPVVREVEAGLLDDLLRAEGIRSWVSIPLVSGYEVRGMLSLSSRRPGCFTADDIELFALLGTTVESAILGLAERSGTLDA